MVVERAVAPMPHSRAFINRRFDEPNLSAAADAVRQIHQEYRPQLDHRRNARRYHLARRCGSRGRKDGRSSRRVTNVFREAGRIAEVLSLTLAIY